MSFARLPTTNATSASKSVFAVGTRTVAPSGTSAFAYLAKIVGVSGSSVTPTSAACLR